MKIFGFSQLGMASEPKPGCRPSVDAAANVDASQQQVPHAGLLPIRTGPVSPDWEPLVEAVRNCNMSVWQSGPSPELASQRGGPGVPAIQFAVPDTTSPNEGASRRWIADATAQLDECSICAA